MIMKSTFTASFSRGAHWLKSRRGQLVTGGLGVVIAGAAISCATITRVVLVPPSIPGAEFIGSESCAECHGDVHKNFKTATHARLRAEGNNAVNIGCESCHGPGSIHKESGGSKHTIVNPDKSPDVCFQCHLDKRGEFNLAHSHPVMSGKVTCTDCHNPHSGPAIISGGTALMSDNEMCGKCHTAQRGPFVFEHEAVREGCTVCHNPHGTVNDKMLAQRNANLCLKCHFQQQTAAGAILIGGRDHRSFLGQGTCWSAGCHEAVHGSHTSSSLRF
jgi:predicted CXXCH cytochrome family protein